MALHPPYFYFRKTEQGVRVCHNCDGGVSFMAIEDIDAHTEHLLLLAIEEGTRQKAKELRRALGC